jgi:hypothetical protein
VRRLSELSFFHAPALIAVFLLLGAPLCAQRGGGASSRSGTDVIPPTNFSIRGKVIDATNHAQLDNVRVELRTFTGATVGIMFTRSAGDFEFLNVGVGSYDLIVQQSGYHTFTRQLDLQESIFRSYCTTLRKTIMKQAM